MPKVSEGHRQARREEIVAAAIRAFSTKGFSRASMADVIAESGLSAGAIYGHFSSKRELLSACAAELFNRRRRELDLAIDRGEAPAPGEALARLLREVVAEGVDPRALVQVWAEASLDPEVREIVNQALRMVRGLLERALRAWFTAHPEHAPQGVDEAVRSLLPVLTGLAPGFIVQRAIIDDFDEQAYLAGVRNLLPH
jgi:AcrR family transcriptional regulator